MGLSNMYLLRHRREYTTGIIERGCGLETNKARGVAECLIRSRDHIHINLLCEAHRSTIISTTGKYSTVGCNMAFMERAAPLKRPRIVLQTILEYLNVTVEIILSIITL